MQRQLFWQLHKLSFVLEKRADEALKRELDIGFAQYKVLEAINQNTLTKQNAVAEMLDQTEASISRQVKILQKKGLITIDDVMGNRRARELSLTRVGEDLVRSAEHILDSLQQQTVMSDFSAKDQQVLSVLYSRMLENLKEK